MTKHLAKRVSNYELFFDLAVVLAIGQLTSAIHVENVDANTIFFFLGGCIIILNIWNNEVIYYNKYGDSRRIDIYSIFALMLWLGNMALAFNFDLGFLLDHPSNVQLFNTMLVLCYGTIATQYFLKGRQLGFSNNIKSNVIVQLIYAIPLIPVALGLLPYSNWVLLYSLFPLILPGILRLPLFKNWHQRHFDSEFNFPHALERNQLLTILTFGETVIATIRTFPLSNSSIEGAILFLGMATLFTFYMGQTFINIDHHKHQPTFALFYSHALIIVSLLFFTVGLEFLADHHHHDLGFLFFIGSVIGFYLGVLSTSRYNQDIYKLNRTILVKYLLVLLLGSLVFTLGRHSLIVLGISLVLMNFIMLRISMNFRKQQREKHNIPHPDPKKNLRDFS